MLANTKPVVIKNGRATIPSGSQVTIPAGTKVIIYENSDPNDVRSDVFPMEMYLTSDVDVVTNETSKVKSIE